MTTKDKTINTSDTQPAPARSRFHRKIQLSREIYKVEEHGKQTIQGYMLGVARMSPSKDLDDGREGYEPKEWFALVIRLTAPIVDHSTKAPFQNMKAGDEIYLGGVALQELYQNALDPKNIFEVQITPTTKTVNRNRSWDFQTLAADPEPRAPFGPPILPLRMSGTARLPAPAVGGPAHDLDGSRFASSDLDEIMG